MNLTGEMMTVGNAGGRVVIGTEHGLVTERHLEPAVAREMALRLLIHARIAETGVDNAEAADLGDDLLATIVAYNRAIEERKAESESRP